MRCYSEESPECLQTRAGGNEVKPHFNAICIQLYGHGYSTLHYFDDFPYGVGSF